MKYHTAVPIGRGGMGEVLRAWDPTLNRHVALKYLRSDDPELEERMVREARAQARVSHPNICPVYEVGRHDGRVYVAMQYIDGRPLDEAACDLGVEATVSLMRTVAEAVHAAHAAGLIHRDLKPANILVEETDDGGLKPWVVDFGIARERQVAGATVTGQVLGTPGYLSPEQARGEITSLDRRSDVFSLGVVLYELLAGCRPHRGDSEVEALITLLEGEPTPLRSRASHVPRDLETIVMTCLEPQRERRYSSARALADDLGRFLSGEPVRARPVGWTRRLAVRVRRHPRIALATITGISAILILLGLIAHSRWSASQRVRSAQRFGREVERVENLTRHAFLLPLHDIRPEMNRARERLAWIEEEMERTGEASQGLGHEALGRGALALGDITAARHHLESAWELGEQTPRTAFVLGLSLVQLYRQAMDEAAELRNPTLRENLLAQARRELGEPARSFLEQSRGGAEHPEYLEAWLAFASDDAPAVLSHLELLHSADPHMYQGDLLAGAVHRRRFQKASESGDSKDASMAFEAAQQAFTAAATVGRSDPRPYEELCALWVQTIRMQFFGRGDDPRPAHEAALDACSRALTANPDSVAALLESGRAHRFWASRAAEAGRDPGPGIEAARENALRARELDPSNDDACILLGVCHRIAANAMAESGGDPKPDLLAAVAAYREAIRLRPDDYGAHVSMASARLHLGADAVSRGESPIEDFVAAAEASRRATELYPSLVGAWVNLGIAEGQLGLWYRDTGGEAGPCYARGAQALRRAMEVNPEFYTAHYNLGEMLVEQARGEVRRGLDPTELLTEARTLLEISSDVFSGFAAPSYLLAEGAALSAEHVLQTGDDPAEHLARTRAEAEAGLAIRNDDPPGLVMASHGDLVNARWRIEGGRDPGVQIERGHNLVARALTANPNLASAWLRQAQLGLAAAEWDGLRHRSPARALERVSRALMEAETLNPSNASIHTVTAELWRRRAELQVASGDDPSAEVDAGLEAVRRALEIDATRASAYAEQTRLELLAGRHDAAADSWSEAIRFNPLLARRPPPGLTRSSHRASPAGDAH